MSKGLKALKELKENVWYFGIADYAYPRLDIIEGELKEKEKQDHYVETLEDRINNLETTYARKNKALEIIKKKGINIQEIKFSYSVNEYNICKGDENESLTHEEFELLKEVLL